jgi:hypothetical protein
VGHARTHPRVASTRKVEIAFPLTGTSRHTFEWCAKYPFRFNRRDRLTSAQTTSSPPAVEHLPGMRVMISCGDELREQGPVAGRLLGVRTVGPVFGNHLLLVCECRAHGDQLFRLLLIFLGAIGSWAERARQPAVLVSFRHRERSYVSPLRAYESLRHQVARGTDGERLPAVWIGRRGACRDRAGSIYRSVAGPIGVRAWGEIS